MWGFMARRSVARSSSGARFDEPDVGNPVALPAREAGVLAFAVENTRRAAKERWIEVFERVDADDRRGAPVDPAGDDRHDSATGADVEFGGSRAELVFAHQRGLAYEHFERTP